MNEADIIIRELTNEELSARKPFSHFGWEGSGAFAFNTISDGYWESAKILLKKMNEESNNFAVVDTLIYPLFFNYRHSIETFLKLLYFNYGEQTDQARQEFLEIGHDLQNLWAKLRPFLNKGKKHVGCSVNINAMEHYIKSINFFDPNSMVMRYPIDKDLTVNKGRELHFDFIHFGERMDELCNSLRQLNYELSNQMLEEASLEELNEYLEIIEKYRPKIMDFLQLLRTDADKELNEGFKAHDFFSFLENHEPSEKDKFLDNCESDLLILLDNLFYAGRTVYSCEIRLSTSDVTKQKEFVKFCYQLLDSNGLHFGIKPHEGQINIEGKTSSALFNGISTALSIIDLLPIEN